MKSIEAVITLARPQPLDVLRLPPAVSNQAQNFKSLNCEHTLLKQPVPPGYAQRASVDPERASWAMPDIFYQPNAAKPEDRTRLPGVEDLKTIHGSREYMSAEGFIYLDHLERPLNPLGRTGLCGRGSLWNWGSNKAADALVFARSGADLLVLLIARKDGSWAMPGGFQDLCELTVATAFRELSEEAIENGAALKSTFLNEARMIFRGYVDDHRNTDHAWIETDVHMLNLSPKLASQLKLRAADDAQAVRWTKVADLDRLKLHACHRTLIQLGLKKLESANGK